MILIQSIDIDVSTNEVIKWLLKYNAKFTRINNITEIKQIKYIDDNFEVEFENGIKIDFNEIKSYWFRRGSFRKHVEVFRTENENFNKAYGTHLFAEHTSLKNFFINFIKTNIYCIGDSISCTDVNKNIILQTAKKFKLNTPEFIITTNKHDVKNFLKRHHRIVTKPIHSTFTFSTDDYWHATYTEEITELTLEKIPDTFEPTLFQKYIEKKYEIRTFYIDKYFYSMAIFSQNDPQTKVDFRVYNDEKPNRYVPFKLPKNIEDKLNTLMKALNFESGSIDLLYSTDSYFYFLEINPVGQFGMVSYPCNYELEKKIAECLLKPGA